MAKLKLGVKFILFSLIVCSNLIELCLTSNSNDTTTTTGHLTNESVKCNVKLNKITGNIHSLQHDDVTTLKMSLMNTKILVNYGQFIGYPREDGSFEIDDIPSDSYIVEVTHPRYIYEPVRVDITSKGKIRARRVNYIQPSIVQTLDYPLVFRPKSLHNYFTPRETWRFMDVLLNPMVMMMVVPLVIIWLLPKMMNPQEVQAQQQNNPQMPEYNVPELSEMMASIFGGQRPSRDGAGNQALTSGTGSSGSQSTGSGGNSRHGKAKRR